MKYVQKVVSWLLLFGLFVAFSGSANAYTDQGAQDFVEKVYKLYGAEQFAQVYDLLHPVIKEKATEDDYVAFQRRHFERLRLSILEVSSNKPQVAKAMPKELTALFSNVTIDGVILAVPISYRAQFYTMRLRQTRTVTKDVHLLFVNDTYYLLWDPSPIKENTDE